MIEEIKINCDRNPILYIPEIIYSQEYMNMHQVNVPMQLSMMMPLSPRKVPLIIWLEGGSFCTLNREYAMPELVYLAEAGYAVASVRYRVSSEGAYPGAVDDVRTALRFLRENAERFYIDGERVGIIGRSAGGTIASMIGAAGNVSCVVSMYAIYCFDTLYADLSGSNVAKSIADVENYLGTYGESNDQRKREASPFFHVDPHTSPHLLLHGKKDPMIPLNQSTDYHRKLMENDIPAELLLIEGAGHGTVEFDQQCVKDRITLFFNKYLRP